MSSWGGLLFLFGGLMLFALGILLMVVLERSRQKPKQTVAHFQRSRSAMHKIFRAQLARREAARARARDDHPARRFRHRKSA